MASDELNAPPKVWPYSLVGAYTESQELLSSISFYLNFRSLLVCVISFHSYLDNGLSCMSVFIASENSRLTIFPVCWIP